MAVCPGHGHSRRACSVSGASGSLSTGDVVTGNTAIRAVSMANGLVKITLEAGGAGQLGACHLYLNDGHTADGHGDNWRRCFNATYGDWSYYVTSITTNPDRVRVIEATDDAAELSIEWDAHSLGSPGLVQRTSQNVVAYDSGGGLRYWTAVLLRKVVRLERGKPGYFLAYRSVPDPTVDIDSVGDAWNNDKDRGEREFGTGSGTAVAWASNGKVAYFPAWRTQRDWSAVTAAIPTFDNFAWWPGIDDADYSPWNDATVVAMQPAGFPAEQATGPWYVADIPTADAGTDDNIFRIVVQKNPNEIGVWCYAGQEGGSLVNHITTSWVEANGARTRFQVFIGADDCAPDATAVVKSGYTGTVAYGNEPSSVTQTRALAIATAVWEDWPT